MHASAASIARPRRGRRRPRREWCAAATAASSTTVAAGDASAVPSAPPQAPAATAGAQASSSPPTRPSAPRGHHRGTSVRATTSSSTRARDAVAHAGRARRSHAGFPSARSTRRRCRPAQHHLRRRRGNSTAAARPAASTTTDTRPPQRPSTRHGAPIATGRRPRRRAGQREPAARCGRIQSVSTHASCPRAAGRRAPTAAAAQRRCPRAWRGIAHRAARDLADAKGLAPWTPPTSPSPASRARPSCPRGEVSARELVELYLGRIGRLDPQLNAFRVVLAERALAEADQADGRRREGDARPLLGVPIAIKDDTDVAGEVTRTARWRHDGPAARTPRSSAACARPARSILGKTHVPELEIAGRSPSRRRSAPRATRGTSRRTPAARAAARARRSAAGLAAAALGTDGAGSIRIPAACCGLFGLKPQRDRMPMADQRWHGHDRHGRADARRARHRALFLDARPQRRRAGLRRGGGGRARRAADRGLDEGAARDRARLDAEQRGAVRATAERCCASSATRSSSATSTTATPRVTSVLTRYLRGSATRRTRCRTRGGSRADARDGARWAADPALRRRARAPARPPTARLGARLRRRRRAAHARVTTPAAARRRLRGRLRRRSCSTGWRASRPTRRVEPHRPAGGRGPRRGFTPDGFPSRAARRPPGDEATLLSLAAQLEAAPGWADRRPPRWRHERAARWPADVAHEAGAGLREAFRGRWRISLRRARRPTSSARPTSRPSG